MSGFFPPPGPFDPRTFITRYDQIMYGDLLDRFGPGGAPDDEYFRSLTGATWDEYKAAGHDFRNDSGVRPLKPYSPNVR